jgi:hypothetical protein
MGHNLIYLYLALSNLLADTLWAGQFKEVGQVFVLRTTIIMAILMPAAPVEISQSLYMAFMSCQLLVVRLAE